MSPHTPPTTTRTHIFSHPRAKDTHQIHAYTRSYALIPHKHPHITRNISHTSIAPSRPTHNHCSVQTFPKDSILTATHDHNHPPTHTTHQDPRPVESPELYPTGEISPRPTQPTQVPTIEHLLRSLHQTAGANNKTHRTINAPPRRATQQ
jgi:hypothetical protein